MVPGCGLTSAPGSPRGRIPIATCRQNSCQDLPPHPQKHSFLVSGIQMLKSSIHSCTRTILKNFIAQPILKTNNCRPAGSLCIRSKHYLSDNRQKYSKLCFRGHPFHLSHFLSAKGCLTSSSYSTLDRWKMPEKKPFERLPRNVVPENYDIQLQPDLGAFTFEGLLKIDVEVRINSCHCCSI